MGLDQRVKKLEGEIVQPPPATKTGPDLSALSLEELKLVAKYRRQEGKVTEEEHQQINIICEKIVWR